MAPGDSVSRVLRMSTANPSAMREFLKQGHTLVTKLRAETGFSLTTEACDGIAGESVVRCLVVTRS